MTSGNRLSYISQKITVDLYVNLQVPLKVVVLFLFFYLQKPFYYFSIDLIYEFIVDNCTGDKIIILSLVLFLKHLRK